MKPKRIEIETHNVVNNQWLDEEVQEALLRNKARVYATRTTQYIVMDGGLSRK